MADEHLQQLAGNANPPPKPDPEQIRAALRLLIPPDTVTELRCFHTDEHGQRSTMAGWFDDLSKLATIAARTIGMPAVYVLPNPINPQLLQRARNCTLTHVINTTADKDIVRRLRLLIDFDPEREEGSATASASDSEHEAAIEAARRCRQWLADRGWPAPLLADSGNGAHLVYSIDLPSDKDSLRLVQRVLRALAAEFNTAQVKVDLSTSNASRIWKLYGTVAAKGTPTVERPHRLARILEAPAELEIVDVSLLRELADTVTADKVHTGTPLGLSSAFDIYEFLEWGGQFTPITDEYEKGNARHFVLGNCPLASADGLHQHRGHNRKTEIILSDDGVGFKCFSDDCIDKTFGDLVKKLNQLKGRKYHTDIWAKPERKPDLVCLADVPAEKVEFLADPYIPLSKMTGVEGDPNEGKTYVALAWAAAVTLGKVPMTTTNGLPPASVIYMTAEDGIGDTLRPRFDKFEGDPKRFFVLRGSKQVVDGKEEFGTVTLQDVDLLGRVLQQTQAKLVVVDPIQGFLGAKVDMHRANETRPIMDGLKRLAERYECAIVLIRHLNKAGQGRGIYRGMGSIDLFGALRSVLLAGHAPDDPRRKALVHQKSNCAAQGDAVGYEITADGMLLWTGKSSLTADDILRAEDPDGQRKVEEARQFLIAMLRGGPKSVKEVDKAAKDNGIRGRWRDRAEQRLNVIKRPAGFGEPWVMEIPHAQLRKIEEEEKQERDKPF